MTVKTMITAMTAGIRPAWVRAVTTGMLLIAAVVVSACEKGTASPPVMPTPEVTVIAASAQDVPDEPEFIGQAEASRIVEVRSQVTGIIKERFFSEGKDVKRGDKLYQIDPVPFKAAVLSARARVSQAEARLVQAKQNHARVKPLLEEQAVSQKDVDDAIAEELAAKAALEGAKGDLVKAQFDFDNTLITAPINGLIERTRYYEGRLVTAQTDLLTIIHQVDPMYVIVNAPESFLLKRRRDQIAHRIEHAGMQDIKGVIKFSDGSTYAHQGVLDFTDVGLRTETSSRQARFVFPNPERVLLPGQFVTVRFVGTVKTDVILVPLRAVQQGPTGPVVYIVGADDKVDVRSVQATAWREKDWLIEDGLKPGERVIVEGFPKIMPGIVVKAVMSNNATNAAGSGAPSPASGPGSPQPGQAPEEDGQAPQAAGDNAVPPAETPAAHDRHTKGHHVEGAGETRS